MAPGDTATDVRETNIIGDESSLGRKFVKKPSKPQYFASGFPSRVGKAGTLTMVGI
mgnify:CR=1 FL=1